MSESASKGKSASELFPGLMQGNPEAKQAKPEPPKERSPSREAQPTIQPSTNSLPVQPPPPDISWLKTGQFEEKATITNIPTVLILVQDEKAKVLISEAMQEFDYQVEYAQSAKEAIERTKHLTPTIIILHTDMAKESTDGSKFHSYMSGLQMSKRRNILYILIGSQFRTLYNLHALSYSANLVVNSADVEHLAVIIRKGLQDYIKLFAPFAEAIQLHTK